MNVKILILSHPLGELGVMYTVHLWLAGKCVWLLISTNWIFLASFHGCGTIKQNLSKSAFSEGVGRIECKFLVDEDVARNPSMENGPQNGGFGGLNSKA